MDNNCKNLWIFGAGASASLGFPLSNNLFKESIKLVTKDFKTNLEEFMRNECLTVDIQAVPNLLEEIKTKPEIAIKYRKHWETLKPSDENKQKFVDIQELFHAWLKLLENIVLIKCISSPVEILEYYPEDLIQKVETDLGINNGDKELIIKLISDIYFFTLSHFEVNIRKDEEKVRSSPYFKIVRHFVLEKPSRIISFNYDTILDYLIAHHYRKSWRYEGYEINGINGIPVIYSNKAELSYIKPHGSLNFLICPNCNKSYLYFDWTFRKTGPNTFASENRRCLHCQKPREGRKELLTSFMLRPSFNKEINKKILKLIKEAFQWANQIFVIGYSFPDQDKYILEFVKKGLNRNTNSDIKINIVSNNHDNAKSQADKIKKYANNKVKIDSLPYEGFEDFVEKYRSIYARSCC